MRRRLLEKVRAWYDAELRMRGLNAGLPGSGYDKLADGYGTCAAELADLVSGDWIIEHLGTAPCRTPACGDADIVQIGRLRKVVCQRCAGVFAVSPATYERAASPEGQHE